MLLCLAGAGCGGPPENLSKTDAGTLAASREDLDDALDSEETLRTSQAEARRLRAKVQRIVSRGGFEQSKLDEFGLASLGELMQIVPSLVRVDADAVPVSLDMAATADFLRYAETDAPRALLRPVREEVGVIERTLHEADAGPDTRIPRAGRTVSKYLQEAESDLRPVWPALSRRLATTREGL